MKLMNWMATASMLWSGWRFTRADWQCLTHHDTDLHGRSPYSAGGSLGKIGFWARQGEIALTYCERCSSGRPDGWHRRSFVDADAGPNRREVFARRRRPLP